MYWLELIRERDISVVKQNNFLKFAEVERTTCFTIIFVVEILGRLIKTRYFTVELIGWGGDDKRLRFSDAFCCFCCKNKRADPMGFRDIEKISTIPTTSLLPGITISVIPFRMDGKNTIEINDFLPCRNFRKRCCYSRSISRTGNEFLRATERDIT